MTPQSPSGLCAPEDEYLTVHQVAERFGMHPNSVYKQLASGVFPIHARKIGRVWRISRRSVDLFFSEVEHRYMRDRTPGGQCRAACRCGRWRVVALDDDESHAQYAAHVRDAGALL